MSLRFSSAGIQTRLHGDSAAGTQNVETHPSTRPQRLGRHRRRRRRPLPHQHQPRCQVREAWYWRQRMRRTSCGSRRRQHGTPGYSASEPLSPSAHLRCPLSTQPSRSPVLSGLAEDPAVWTAKMAVVSPPTLRRKSVASKQPCSSSIPPLEVSTMSSPCAALKTDRKGRVRERSAGAKGKTVVFSFPPAGLPIVRWARGQDIPASPDHACHCVPQRNDPRVQKRGYLLHQAHPSPRSAIRYVRSSHPATPRVGKCIILDLQYWAWRFNDFQAFNIGFSVDLSKDSAKSNIQYNRR